MWRNVKRGVIRRVRTLCIQSFISISQCILLLLVNGLASFLVTGAPNKWNALKNEDDTQILVPFFITLKGEKREWERERSYKINEV